MIDSDRGQLAVAAAVMGEVELARVARRQGCLKLANDVQPITGMHVEQRAVDSHRGIAFDRAPRIAVAKGGRSDADD